MYMALSYLISMLIIAFPPQTGYAPVTLPANVKEVPASN